MKKQELETKLQSIKKGCFVKAKWKSVKVVNGVECEKVSNGVVRLVKYANIKGVSVKGKENVNETCLIENTLYHNAKSNSYLVQLATTTIKPKVEYFVNGVIVDKQTYDLNAKTKPTTSFENRVVFRVKLENLLELGN